jgi:hypothetical protein
MKMTQTYFQRLTFTTPPVFGEEYIVGNLNQIVEKIEQHIKQSLESNHNVKENLPFHCVINPPRHGKSLLLDRLFLNDKTVIVIGLTYNSTTGLIDEELESPSTALKWFWIRVLKSMLQLRPELRTLSNLLQIDQCDWPAVQSLIIADLSSNPFLDETGQEKNILFCIDEFSVLTDRILQRWERDQQKEFISRLHSMKQACYPFLQIVMTGFHLNMNTLLKSSSTLQCYTLDLCDISSSRPLLKKILETYKEHSSRFEDPIHFPLFLFEVVKSTPGLIGFWAENLQRNFFCRTIYDFAQQMVWVNNIIRLDHGGPLKSNWLLIYRYLIRFVEESSEGLAELEEEIVAAEIGKRSPLEIIPLCFVAIVGRASLKYCGEDPVQQKILDKLAALFAALGKIRPEPDKKDGKPFEQLTLTALHVRLLLLNEIQCGNDRVPPKGHPTIHFEDLMESTATETKENSLIADVVPREKLNRRINTRFRSFFHVPASESYSGLHPTLAILFSVHLIRSKESLQHLLLPPLYHIFPLGIQSLEPQWDQETSSTLRALIDSRRDDYRLAPLDGNAVIYLSPKDPPTQGQSILSSRQNVTMTAETVAAIESMFLRIKASTEGAADILQTSQTTLSEDDQKVYELWKKRLISSTVQLKRSIDRNHSLIDTADGAEGADLLIVWRQDDTSEDDFQKEVIHIAALELKDQRQTPIEHWEKKWNALMSPLCILHWMPLFYREDTFSIHFIFAGREHSQVDGVGSNIVLLQSLDSDSVDVSS